MIKTILNILFAFIGLLTFGQKHAQNWYFGHHTGISFIENPPLVIKKSALIQREGNATISDENGNLLFYTDGMRVWTKKHQLMKNGNGLLGQPTAAQSAIIAKQPGKEGVYFIFTVSDWENKQGGLFYSIVDMKLNNGLGIVTEKNILMNKNVREQISAVYANHELDVWILCHENFNSNFVTYKLTENGITEKPIFSELGVEYKGKNRYGQLKFSANGQLVCSSLGGNEIYNLYIYDFDKKTGKVSNERNLSSPDLNKVYSSEFSPNGKVLYVSAFNGSYIYQFDLSSGNEVEIKKSRYNIAQSNKDVKSCLQIGSDHRIYVSKGFQKELGAIKNPDNLGSACNYDNSFVLLSGKCGIGLPNFIQSYFEFRQLPGQTSRSEVIENIEEKQKEKPILHKEIKETIHFETNSSQISPDMGKRLDELLVVLQENPNYDIIIQAHTDCIGSESNNLRLSDKRAKATMDYLKSKNSELNILEAEGYGESDPVSKCKCEECTPEELKKDRRTNIKLIPK